MIEKEDTFYAKDSKRLIIIGAALLLVGLLFVVYKNTFFLNATYRYTVADVNGVYRDSKTFGITFSYTVHGVRIDGNCIDQECKNVEQGTRCIVKYFVDRPTWNSLYPNLIVPQDLSPPIDGWREIPEQFVQK